MRRNQSFLLLALCAGVACARAGTVSPFVDGAAEDPVSKTDGAGAPGVADGGCSKPLTESASFFMGVVAADRLVRGVAAGDLDSDGKADLAVLTPTTQGSLELGIWLNKPGGFTQAQVTAVPPANERVDSSVRAMIAIADLDGNGKNDLLVAGSRLVVFMAEGDGRFTPAAPLDVVTRGMAVADMNGDKRPDVVVRGSLVGAESLAQLFVLINDGKGRFPAFDHYALSSLAGAPPSLRDFDGDGDQDVLFADKGRLLLGRNNAAKLQMVDLGKIPDTAGDQLLVADLEQDGRLDFVFSGQILKNDPGGKLVPIAFPTLMPLAAADFDKDGDEDVWAVGSDEVQQILINDGGAKFRPGGAILVRPPDERPGVATVNPVVAVADLDGDLLPDLIGQSFGRLGVAVLKGSALAQLPSFTDVAVGHHPELVIGADLDGDGDVDLVTANGGTAAATVLRNDGNRQFVRVAEIMTEGTRLEGLVARDFDKDGHLDLAVAAEFSDPPSQLAVFMGNGDLTFDAPVAVSVPGLTEAIDAADVDGDGDDDVVASNGSGTSSITILENDGRGRFPIARQVTTGSNPGTVVFVDVDHDGAPDVAAANEGADTISVLRNDGRGRFAAPVDYPSGPIPDDLAAADLDGDGFPEIVIADADLRHVLPTGGDVAILWNDGHGRFGRAQRLPQGGQPRSLTLADLDGDGHLDILSGDAVGNAIAVFANRGRRELAQTSSLLVDGNPRGIVVLSPAGQCGLTLAVTKKALNEVRILGFSGR